MKYWVRDKEAGNKIDCFMSEQEALDAITAYESDDMKNNVYTPDFYEVYPD